MLRSAFLALFAFLAVALGSAAAAPVQAAAGDWVETDQTRVRLIAASDQVGEGQLRLGVEIELKPGWKTYWRSPGDAGYPPSIDWSGSQNLAATTFHWPLPHRFTLFGLETFGYDAHVIFPIDARATDPAQPLSLRAHLRYLVCEEICIPYEHDLTLDLPAGAVSAAAAEAQAIDRFMAVVPGDGTALGLTLQALTIAEVGEGERLVAELRSTLLPFEKPDLIVEAPAGYMFAAPDVILSEGGMAARFEVAVAHGADAPPLETAPITLTLVDGLDGGQGPRGMEKTATAERSLAGSLFLPALIAALLGGLILNLMPCVLPVLSLKLVGLIAHGGAPDRAVRFSFLATAAGILTAFLALAAILIALKSLGLAIGWGLQFQQPWFLTAMSLLLILFAANLFGAFEIPLPGWLGNRLDAAAPADRSGFWAPFLTGALATLLATPCSAPFVGTAVGFALARGALEILAIFAALGLGLALPYLGVALWPRLATALPRPGRWMIWLRYGLGLALLATALWLLWVLAGGAGRWAAMAAGILALATALAFGLKARASRDSAAPGRDRRATLWRVVATVTALGAILLPLWAPADDRPEAPLAAYWQPFAPAEIAVLVAEDKIVFVDVTADWCVTCLANKRLVLDQPAVSARLADVGVVAMRADWTEPDATIADYLTRHGRYGIPFNAVYGPGAPQGILLPELLSTEAVLAALAAAGGLTP